MSAEPIAPSEGADSKDDASQPEHSPEPGGPQGDSEEERLARVLAGLPPAGENALDFHSGYAERNEEANAAAEKADAPGPQPRELVLGRDLLPTDADSAREAEFAALRAAGIMEPLPGDELAKAAQEPGGIDLDEAPSQAAPASPPPELGFAMSISDIREMRFVDKEGNGYYLDETRAGEYQLRLFWRNPNPPKA